VAELAAGRHRAGIMVTHNIIDQQHQHHTAAAAAADGGAGGGGGAVKRSVMRRFHGTLSTIDETVETVHDDVKQPRLDAAAAAAGGGGGGDEVMETREMVELMKCETRADDDVDAALNGDQLMDTHDVIETRINHHQQQQQQLMMMMMMMRATETNKHAAAPLNTASTKQTETETATMTPGIPGAATTTTTDDEMSSLRRTLRSRCHGDDRSRDDDAARGRAAAGKFVVPVKRRH